jgi:hypothetical protein
MVVLGYAGTAAVVLALVWAAVRLTPLARRNPALAALAVVGVFGLIAITPFCGVMFDCGCDWPWRGLHLHCNVFDAAAKLKCPWCDSKVAGSLSMLTVFGLSSAAAYGVSAGGAVPMLGKARATARFGAGVAAGILAFHLVSLATATLAALATGYPLPFTA